MSIINVRVTCPVCGNRERMPVSGPMKVWQGANPTVWQIATQLQAGGLTATAATTCPECKLPFGVLLSPTGAMSSLFQTSGGNDHVDSCLAPNSVKTVPIGPTKIESSPILPEKIQKAFVYIQEDAEKRRNATGILSGARGCLDVALKELGEKTGGRRDRINSLATKGIITTGIAEWAQGLWEDGSDAVHDLDADIDRAIEHVAFLKLFFEVAFILPARIRQAAHLPEASS